MKFLLRAAAVFFIAGLVTARASTQSPSSGEDLPDGEGKKILESRCTSCHELTEVTKFRGYYNRAQWRDIVVTMVEYGADLKKPEIETLADYLAQHLGKYDHRITIVMLRFGDFPTLICATSLRDATSIAWTMSVFSVVM